MVLRNSNANQVDPGVDSYVTNGVNLCSRSAVSSVTG